MNIVIVEDHLMMRELLKEVCVGKLGHDVIGEATNGIDAINIIVRSNPEVVLLDLRLPKVGGFEVVRALRQISSPVKILVISAYCDSYTVFVAEKIKIDGFLSKTSTSVEILREAINAVSIGIPYFSEPFRSSSLLRHSDPMAFDKILSDREQEVMAQIGDLSPDPDICRSLTISPATLAKHRLNISRKIKAAGRVALERYAVEHGFTTHVDTSN